MLATLDAVDGPVHDGLARTCRGRARPGAATPSFAPDGWGPVAGFGAPLALVMFLSPGQGLGPLVSHSLERDDCAISGAGALLCGNRTCVQLR
ncbi:hypothetical protein NOCA1190019 [metagenome]|uniref:Uncharacterized protein n=1 Tax=metagenome TaxID=256318 RepID=A0A2P2CCE0_9ZZZZ